MLHVISPRVRRAEAVRIFFFHLASSVMTATAFFSHNIFFCGEDCLFGGARLEWCVLAVNE